MAAAPGWYPDPAGGNGRRYFDGTNWTQQTAPPPNYVGAPPFRRPVPPQQPKSNKGTATLWSSLTLLGIVVVIGLVGSLMSRGSNPGDRPDWPTSSDSPMRSTGAAVGQEVRDGKFAFTVNGASVSDATFGMSKPRGQWVIVDMTVTNIGNEPQSFFVQNQKLFDAQDREYAADSMAALSINDESTMIINMNPGFKAKVLVPFDIPPGITPRKVEVHDSAFSGGATVRIH